jgi:hypothetical protein
MRPENVLLAPPDGSGHMHVPAQVEATIYQGALIRYRLAVAGQTVFAEVQNQLGRPQHAPGSAVSIYWFPERTEVLPAA